MVAQTTPNLPFSDVNLVVLTDVHSWVGGHPSEPSLDATYGDVLSFCEHLQRYAEEHDQDVWLIQNGDWIDGTGLAMDGDPSHLVPLIEKMPFDIVNTGNHELYRNSVVDYMIRPGGYIDWWGDRYLSSNVYVKDAHGRKKAPLGNQYAVLEGKHSKILVFGFLYDMSNAGSRVMVQQVEKTVKERWFHKALTETKGYNAIIVMTHAGHDDPAVAAIHDTIRKVIQDDTMPIQFIAGHTHYRQYAVLDPTSTVVEAGKYLDTIGWVSFANKDSLLNRQRNRQLQNENPTVETAFPTGDSPSPAATAEVATTAAPADVVSAVVADGSFQHVFLDGNVDTLQQTLRISSRDKFETASGKALKEFIQETRQKMGLTNRIGCAPKDYFLNASMTHDNSLWKLFDEQVVPRELIRESSVCRTMFLRQGSWRYDLLGGNDLTYDNIFAVSPFDNPIFLVATVPGNILLQLNATMNENASEDERYFKMLPAWILSGNIGADGDCELYSRSADLPIFKAALQQLYPDVGEPILQNVTSTTIWLSFVTNHWHCFEGVFDSQWWSQEAHQAIESSENSALTAGLIILVVCFVVVCLGSLVMYFFRRFCWGVIRVGNESDYTKVMTSFHSEKLSGDEEDEADSDAYNGDGKEDDTDDNDGDSQVRMV
jgi:2',3'-cyclic-nucleotide 2'-phosphodiesterase (5'-nucleotidase family)